MFKRQVEGFPSIERFYPVRPVQQGNLPLPLVAKKFSRERLDRFEYRFNLKDAETVISNGVTGYMERMPTAGLIAVRGHDVLLERYSLGPRIEKRWISFSITKTVVSLMVGAAIKDGYF